jgi:hypothetical protein
MRALEALYAIVAAFFVAYFFLIRPVALTEWSRPLQFFVKYCVPVLGFILVSVFFLWTGEDLPQAAVKWAVCRFHIDTFVGCGGKIVEKAEDADSPNNAVVRRFPAPADPCSGAAEDWKRAASVGTREAYADHMVRFPNCPFVALAKGNIESLDRKGTERWEQQRVELEKQEAARKKSEEEEAALKETQRKEDARKEKEQQDAARKKAEEEQTARREAETRREAAASQSIQQPQPFELPYATHPYQLPYSTDYVPPQVPPPPVPCPDPRGLPCIPR